MLSPTNPTEDSHHDIVLLNLYAFPRTAEQKRCTMYAYNLLKYTPLSRNHIQYFRQHPLRVCHLKTTFLCLTVQCYSQKYHIGQLSYHPIKAYHQFGESGLARKGTSNGMKKKRQRTEAEMDELEMLRKRNEYLEAENALLKKVKALVEEREARLRAIGQKPSKD